MKFKVGDKVKLTKKALVSIQKYSYEGVIINKGVIVDPGNPYTQVGFQQNQVVWWIKNTSLELIKKNQQLLFNFME